MSVTYVTKHLGEFFFGLCSQPCMIGCSNAHILCVDVRVLYITLSVSCSSGCSTGNFNLNYSTCTVRFFLEAAGKHNFLEADSFLKLKLGLQVTILVMSGLISNKHCKLSTFGCPEHILIV